MGAEICSFASGYPIIPARVVEKIIFSHWNNLSRCSKSVDHIVGSISELANLCHSFSFLFSYQYYIVLITVALSFLKSGSLSPSSAFFFFKVVLATPGPLHFHITLESVCQLLQTGMLRSDFDHWTCRSFGKNCHLNDIESDNTGACCDSSFIQVFQNSSQPRLVDFIV